MDRIKFLTAGESHGQALTCIVEGIPAGLELSEEEINTDLRRRQRGYGRGDRMRIEQDRVKILAGIRYGKTLGSPIAMMVENRDWPNWQEKMALNPVPDPAPVLQVPRPGHADFAGMVKYRQNDLRTVLERSSARETTIRVAAGAVARKLLLQFGISIHGHVVAIGGIKAGTGMIEYFDAKNSHDPVIRAQFIEIMDKVERSPLACADEAATVAMQKAIDEARKAGDSLGGMFENIAIGVPVGLGSHVHWDRRLDTALAAAMMSIPAIKAVEIGLGTACAQKPGSRIHDEIFFDKVTGYYRMCNHAGGIEGGISNGEPV
ncbi:chorismate synthase, partial [candidate division KSB1 bacterium]|nr:chorismate synthase [candidate division KSB1 bacterium]